MNNQETKPAPTTLELLRRYQALSKNPGNMTLIKEHADYILEKASGNPFSDLVGFLTAQAPYVKESDLPALSMLVEQAIKKQVPQADAQYCDKDPRERLEHRLTEFRNTLRIYKISNNPQELRKRMEEVSEMREISMELGEEANDLEFHNFQIKSKIQILDLASDFKVLLKAVETGKDLTARAYMLQQCETIVRQLISLEIAMDSGGQETSGPLLADLRKASQALRDESQQQESEAVWRAFMVKHGPKIEKLAGWDFKRPQKTIEKHICDLRNILKIAQQELGKLTHAGVVESALPEVEKLHASLQHAGKIQQNRYNAWAMEAIKQGYQDGLKHAGVIDNEEKIGAALIQHLGPIDMRFLTAEVQRCYSEVFEYLYNRLDKPGDPGDFEDKANKLYVLKKMMDCTKKEVADL